MSDAYPESQVKLLPQSILIVDDDQDFREILTEWTKEEMPDYSVDTSKNGVDAVEQWMRKRHSVVILDQFMPGKSGVLVHEIICSATKKNPEFHPVVIMVTGTLSTMLKTLNLNVRGMDDHLTKPVRRDILFTSIRRALEKRQLK